MTGNLTIPKQNNAADTVKVSPEINFVTSFLYHMAS